MKVGLQVPFACGASARVTARPEAHHNPLLTECFCVPAESTDATHKTCKKCGLSLPYSDFYPHKQTRDRLRQECKSCQKAIAKEWRDANPERARANARSWRERNPERAAELVAAWNLAHPEQRLAISRQWAIQHPDRVRSNVARYNAARRASYVEEVAAAVLFERDGGICGLCGLPVDPKRWHIDHIIPLIHLNCECVWRKHAAPTHSYANTRVTHPSCNTWKKGRLDSELPAVPSHILASAQTDAARAAA